VSFRLLLLLPAHFVQVATSISGSYQGNTARRAAMLCSQLQVCAGDMGDTCQITSTIAGISAERNIDLCTVEGVQGGSLATGIVRSMTLPAGKCRVTADCNNTDLMCSMATEPSSLCTCSNGVDSCYQLGSCVPTPCKRCNSCLQDVRDFARSVMYQTSPSAIAEAFRVHCLDKMKRPQATCAAAVAAITGSQGGNIGKRAAGLCQLLQDCEKANLGAGCSLSSKVAGKDTEVFSSGVLDLCTLEGIPGGSSLPGISLTGVRLPPGTCDSNADCKTAGHLCSKKDTRPLCR
jgi:hypothetical protein